MININRNTERIFLLVNYRRILPTEIFPRYLPRELQLKKKLKQSKKNDDVPFLATKLPTEHYSISKIVGELSTLFIMLITKRITDGTFRRCFTESSGIIHFPIALLITVFYRQNHQWIEKSLVIFGGF